MRLAAGLCPGPLGELKRSPRPPSRNKGGLLLREGEGRGGEGKRRGKGKGGKGKGRGWEGRDPPRKNPGYGRERRGTCASW